MSTSAVADDDANASANSRSGNQPGKNKGTPPNRKGPRPPEATDERKKRKSSGDRRDREGFGDGVERAACSFFRHTLPPDFPVQQRTNVAALVPRIVARRTSAVLICDCIHDGPHAWPDGDPAEETE